MASELTADQRRRLRELFGQAMDLDPNARAAFVARECSLDEALRWQLRLLLDAAPGEGDGFLADPALSARALEVWRESAAREWQRRKGPLERENGESDDKGAEDGK